MPRPRQSRKDYVAFQRQTSRWRDNDVYGHMNNVVFYEYVDSCVNMWVADAGGLGVPDGPVIGLVVESACLFHAPLGYPAPVETGLRVARIGRSSVAFEVGLFAPGGDLAHAEARLTHVYVDRDSRRPQPLPPAFRTALSQLLRS